MSGDRRPPLDGCRGGVWTHSPTDLPPARDNSNGQHRRAGPRLTHVRSGADRQPCVPRVMPRRRLAFLFTKTRRSFAYWLPARGGTTMTIPRRRFLYQAAGVAALPAVSRVAWASLSVAAGADRGRISAGRRLTRSRGPWANGFRTEWVSLSSSRTDRVREAISPRKRSRALRLTATRCC